VEYAAILMQATGMKKEITYVNLGYRGVDKDNLDIDIKHRGKIGIVFIDRESRKVAVLPAEFKERLASSPG
jgi:hypothetical protein